MAEASTIEMVLAGAAGAGALAPSPPLGLGLVARRHEFDPEAGDQGLYG